MNTSDSPFAHALRALPSGASIAVELVNGERVDGELLLAPHGTDFIEVDGWVVAIAHIARFRRET